MALVLTLMLGLAAGTIQAGSAPEQASTKSPWKELTAQAESLGLPTKFLTVIPPDFVTLEFEDLHTFAAEYHPKDHRMLLNLALSFNGAGGALKPLGKMTHREVGTLFHELFHAYMDYIWAQPEKATLSPELGRLRAFAEDQQRCRYQVVAITPVVQRKTATELRFLTEKESWEALNESWAIFVGWAIWSQLELSPAKMAKRESSTRNNEKWLQRLKKADRDGDLVGYYEPEDPAERQIAHKRYLAPPHRLTPREIKTLLEVVFGDSQAQALRAAAVMEQHRPPLKEALPCRG